MNEIDHDYHVQEDDTIEISFSTIVKGYFYPHTSIAVVLTYLLDNSPRKKKVSMEKYHLVLLSNCKCPLPLHATLASLNITSSCNVLSTYTLLLDCYL